LLAEVFQHKRNTFEMAVPKPLFDLGLRLFKEELRDRV